MSRCIACGREEAEERRYACVTQETELRDNPEGKGKIRVIRETVTEIIPAAVCIRCARKKKIKMVLKTVLISLVVTPILAVMSLFTARPNRNIRSEIADMPIVLPVVAVIVWICGLSVFLPIPRDMYMTDILRDHFGLDPSQFLVPLDRRSLTRRRQGPVRAGDVRGRCPVKTDLAEQLLPLIEGTADEADEQALIGRTFVAEQPAR